MQHNHNDFKVVCLQRYPEYYEQTVALLNNQWPRSRTARLRSLEQGSRDSLPTSLVLLQKDDNGKDTVVAHSKISPVPYQPKLCFIESVVVAPQLRGKGLGRLIMERTESYVKALGITTVYLTTFDQQGFYSRLGYELCDPIVVFGGSIRLIEKVDNFKVFSITHSPSSNQPLTNPASARKTTNDNDSKSQISVPPPPPPPPLPPLQNQSLLDNNNITNASKVTMRKLLHKM
ncbi:unnamed protein product [Orchesella dallaii]|uniref:N-acetyltransferase domain-containing protein n=1 Tax=Orchesella dallaii TaxID=48710 RepID=A0ABP1QWI8_9HEXA